MAKSKRTTPPDTIKSLFVKSAWKKQDVTITMTSITTLARPCLQRCWRYDFTGLSNQLQRIFTVFSDSYRARFKLEYLEPQMGALDRSQNLLRRCIQESLSLGAGILVSNVVQLSRWIALPYVRSFASPRTTNWLYSQPPPPGVGPTALAGTPQNPSTNSSHSNKLAGENVKQRARNIRGFSTRESTTTKRERVHLLAR